MKIHLLSLCMVVSAVVTVGMGRGKPVKRGRRLAAVTALEGKMLNENKKISVAKIREEVSELHRGIKLCINTEFAKDPEDILPFDTIREMCAGYNYSIITRLFKAINYEVKEIIKEKIKTSIPQGFCDNILIMCLEYFEVLELVMDKNFDIMATLRENQEELEQRINQAKLEYLLKLTAKQIADYNVIRNDVQKEREFFDKYFEFKVKEYHEIIEKRHTNNQKEQVTQALFWNHERKGEYQHEQEEQQEEQPGEQQENEQPEGYTSEDQNPDTADANLLEDAEKGMESDKESTDMSDASNSGGGGFV